MQVLYVVERSMVRVIWIVFREELVFRVYFLMFLVFFAGLRRAGPSEKFEGGLKTKLAAHNQPAVSQKPASQQLASSQSGQSAVS